MKLKSVFLSLVWAVILSNAIAFAQTNAITYQGRLNDGAAAASGTYNMQFSVWDAASGGNQLGSTITNTNVSVANGVFTVTLDFSPATPFATGADRFLLVSVKKPADPTYTDLTPRQPITSSPYSLRTLSAAAADNLSSACVGCVTDAKVANGISYSKLSGAPTSLPPSGAAGGDLTGTFPNPTVAANAVTTAKIADGTIVNADISPTAAIANTKIAGLGSLATVTPTGTGNATTYLRGDNSWAPVAAGGGPTVFSGRTTNIIVNSSTFVDVITVDLEANKTYFFEAGVYGQRVGAVSGTANVRVTYTGTATTDLGIEILSTIAGTTFNSTSFDYEAGSSGGTNNFGATLTKEFPISGYIKTTTAGTLAIKVARGASNTTIDLNVREGTYLMARPLN